MARTKLPPPTWLDLRLKEASEREKRSVQQVDVAAATGLSKATISRAKRAAPEKIPIETRLKLASYFLCSEQDLFRTEPLRAESEPKPDPDADDKPLRRVSARWAGEAGFDLEARMLGLLQRRVLQYVAFGSDGEVMVMLAHHRQLVEQAVERMSFETWCGLCSGVVSDVVRLGLPPLRMIGRRLGQGDCVRLLYDVECGAVCVFPLPRDGFLAGITVSQEQVDETDIALRELAQALYDQRTPRRQQLFANLKGA